jgi:putative transposase
VPARVSATDRIRTKINALFAEGRELPEIIEEVARLGAQLLMQAALEAEVTEFLGRERYQRTASCLYANTGSRNGYRSVTVKSTTGPVTLERPKLRGTTQAFASRLFGKHVTKTNALETLVIASFVRGLSVRDVQATLAEGDQAAISKSTVSEVCKAIRAEYQAWARRRLDEVTLDYLFLDASFFRMHPGSPAEPVLAAWGITTEGKPVFVGLAPSGGESTDAWADFLTDLSERGLTCPLLIVSDGAKGLIAAIEQVFPHALRQRCLIHRLRNVLAKIPSDMQTEVRDGYWAIFDTADLTVEPGPRLVELVDKRITAFAAKYADVYPAAMKILLTDKAGLTAHLRFPVEHHARVRHSNFIERCFGESKRRTKVIGRFPGETSAISLVWAVLDRASRGWRGLTMTPVGTRLLQDLRRSLLDPPPKLRQPKAERRTATQIPPPPPRSEPPAPSQQRIRIRTACPAVVGGPNLRRRNCPGVLAARDRRRRAQQTRATPKGFLSTHIGDLSAQRLRVTSPRGLSRLIVADPGQRIHRKVLQISREGADRSGQRRRGGGVQVGQQIRAPRPHRQAGIGPHRLRRHRIGPQIGVGLQRHCRGHSATRRAGVGFGVGDLRARGLRCRTGSGLTQQRPHRKPDSDHGHHHRDHRNPTQPLGQR